MDKRVRYSSKQVLDELETWRRIYQESLDHAKSVAPESVVDSDKSFLRGRLAAVNQIIEFWQKFRMGGVSS